MVRSEFERYQNTRIIGIRILFLLVSVILTKFWWFKLQNSEISVMYPTYKWINPVLSGLDRSRLWNHSFGIEQSSPAQPLSQEQTPLLQSPLMLQSLKQFRFWHDSKKIIYMFLLAWLGANSEIIRNFEKNGHFVEREKWRPQTNFESAGVFQSQDIGLWNISVTLLNGLSEKIFLEKMIF